MSEMPKENANQFPINVQLSESQYSVVPENRVTVPVVIENQGAQDDHFEVSLRGIPLDWVDIGTPVVRLGGGERKEIAIVIEAKRTLLLGLREIQELCDQRKISLIAMKESSSGNYE